MIPEWNDLQIYFPALQRIDKKIQNAALAQYMAGRRTQYLVISNAVYGQILYLYSEIYGSTKEITIYRSSFGVLSIVVLDSPEEIIMVG